MRDESVKSAVPRAVVALLLSSCASPSAPDVDYGTCVPAAESSADVEGLHIVLSAEPTVMDYRSGTLLSIAMTNVTSGRLTLGENPDCLVETWVRGEREIPETRRCWVHLFDREAGDTERSSYGLSLRPPGTPRREFRSDPPDHYSGPAAPPAAYCVVAAIEVDGSTARLEAPFRLVDR